MPDLQAGMGEVLVLYPRVMSSGDGRDHLVSSDKRFGHD